MGPVDLHVVHPMTQLSTGRGDREQRRDRFQTGSNSGCLAQVNFLVYDSAPLNVATSNL
jgi:hypothetical protein